MIRLDTRHNVLRMQGGKGKGFCSRGMTYIHLRWRRAHCTGKGGQEAPCLSVNGSVNLPSWGRTGRLTQCGENEMKDPLKGSQGERLKNEPNGLKGELRIRPVGRWAGDGEKRVWR